MTRIPLGSYPTAVERLGPLSAGSAELWIKRDDRTAEVYGGNKVRKLEHLLGEAKEQGKRRVITVGAAGSHQVVAMALFGERLGFEVEAVLVPQPWSSHAEQNLRVGLAHGLRAFAAPAWSLAPPLVLPRLGPDAYFVPLGGSSPLGSLGFVDAARELAAQVRAGQMPEPDVVVVALGSGGTAAGLAVGLEEEGMRTRVVGVAVSHPGPALSLAARWLARRTARLAGASRALGRRAAARLTVDRRWVGRGYGHPTRDGQAAIADAASCGVVLDPTYTAKAFACALAHVRQGRERVVLYWHTLSTAPLEDAGTTELPHRLARLLG